MKKLSDFTNDEELIAYVEAEKERVRANSSQAAARTEKKIERLTRSLELAETNFSELNKKYEKESNDWANKHEEYESKVSQLSKENSNFVLGKTLKGFNVNKKFNDIVIQKTGITPEMDEKEITEKINAIKEDFGEFFVNEKAPSKGPENIEPEDKPVDDIFRTHL